MNVNDRGWRGGGSRGFARVENGERDCSSVKGNAEKETVYVPSLLCLL